jgi:predicted DNA-binding transcriptional regulator AlpA
MKEIKTFTPVKGQRRGFWSVSLLGIVLLASTLWIQYRHAADLLNTPQVEKRRGVLESTAWSIGKKRSELQMRLIALAEQKSLREGVMKLERADTSPRWRDGFLQAMDAVCRSKIAEEPAVRECSLRDLEGNKLAGTDAVFDTVRYPDLLQRVRVEPSAKGSSGDFRERWIVPIRDEKAQPHAYLTAVVRVPPEIPFESLAASDSKARFLLTDSSGTVIAGDEDLFGQMRTADFPQNIRIGGGRFEVVKTTVPESPWTLYLAFPETKVEENLRSLRWQASALVLIAALILIVFTRRWTRGRK